MIARERENAVEVLSNNGGILTSTPYTAAGLSGPFGIAVDSAGGAWVANLYPGTLSHLNSSGNAVGGPYTGAGLSQPVDL